MGYDPEYHKRYREQHRERIRERKRQEYLANREIVKARTRAWSANNKTRKQANDRDYRRRNQDRLRIYMRERYLRDPAKRISAMSAWRKANPELYREQYLRATFGISLADYNALLQRQGGVCAICGMAQKAVLAVDHNHESGEVRGLLCSPCNTGLGHFKDDPQRLKSAAGYLEAADTVKAKDIAS